VIGRGMEIIKIACASLATYITKDGSIIRELMHPAVHGGNNVSLAEAIVPAGVETLMIRLSKATGHNTFGPDRISERIDGCREREIHSPGCKIQS
jgi:hypothetical protein